MKKPIQRRDFLKGSLALAVSSAVPSFWSSLAEAQVESGKHLVFIFMRGGADALSFIAPSGAGLTTLNALRPTIKMVSPIAFSPNLVAHAGLAPLLSDPVIKSRLNFILHSGSVNETRSHFEQQDLIECGNSAQITADGFLARGAQLLNYRTAAAASRLPASMRGGLKNTLVIQDPAQLGPNYAVNNLKPRLSRAQRMGLFKQASGEAGDGVVHNYAVNAEVQYNQLASLIGATTTLDQLMTAGGYTVRAGQFKSGFGQRLAMTAALIGAGPTYGPAFIAVDAEQQWDTHLNLNISSLTNWLSFAWKIEDLALNLVAFKNDLVKRGKWDSTVVVVMSEFGRTVKENGSAGCDHGRGGIMMLMGGAVRAHSEAPYIGPRAITLPTVIDSSAALAVHVDYRAVLAEILQKHMGIPQTTVLSNIFYNQGSVSQYLNVLRV